MEFQQKNWTKSAFSVNVKEATKKLRVRSFMKQFIGWYARIGWLTLAFLLILIGITCNTKTMLTFMWTYFHSDSSIGFWMGHGVDPWSALGIAMIGSTYSVVNAWAIVHADLPLPQSMKAVIGTLFHGKEYRLFVDRPWVYLMFWNIWVSGFLALGLAFGKSRDFCKWQTLAALIIGGWLKSGLWTLVFTTCGHAKIFQEQLGTLGLLTLIATLLFEPVVRRIKKNAEIITIGSHLTGAL
jgi:hypothetical protein